MTRNRMSDAMDRIYGPLNEDGTDAQSRTGHPVPPDAQAEDGYIRGRRILDDTVTFKPPVLEAVRDLARTKPWQGSVPARQEKIRAVHAALCEAYEKKIALEFETAAEDSGESYYAPQTKTIVLKGRISVVTYLQMFGYAVFGPRVEKVVVWSVNLFRRKFPISWGRCHFEGHMVINDNRSVV